MTKTTTKNLSDTVFLVVGTEQLNGVVQTDIKAFTSLDKARAHLMETKAEYADVIEGDENYFVAIGDDSGYDTDVFYNIEKVSVE